MPAESAAIRFLLDEHYPGWLAAGLQARGVDALTLTSDWPWLCGADDQTVLLAAADAGRVVVTEDVTTFRVAISQVPGHLGVVFCHHARFPRTRAGLFRLESALTALATEPPAGLGIHPIEWWLARD